MARCGWYSSTRQDDNLDVFVVAGSRATGPSDLDFQSPRLPQRSCWDTSGKKPSADLPAVDRKLWIDVLEATAAGAKEAETGLHCQARKRLPEKFFSVVASLAGRDLDAQVDRRWLWKGRRVYMFEGTTVTMPDTPENQQAYPQISGQKPGLSFPIARIGGLTSLACGAIVNLGFYRYAGKGQGKVSLLRQLWDVLRPGDVLLTDRLMANWTNILLLQRHGVELVRRQANRRADFRRGQRLGKEDHIVRQFKPSGIRSLDAVHTVAFDLENVQVTPRVDRDSRSEDSKRTTRLPDEGHRRCDEATRSAANDQGRFSIAVPRALEQRTRCALHQVDDADK